jgi:predicted PurR-regulated permease PerM
MVVHPAVLNEARHVPGIITRWIQGVPGLLLAFAGNMIWVVIVPVMTFFMLLDFHKMVGKIFLLVPIERRTGMLNIVTEIIAVIGNYVRGVLIVMLSDIVLIYIVLRLFGLQSYALPLAIMAGVLYTIPYFGAIVSTIGIGLTAFIRLHLAGAIEVTFVMILIHQVFFDNVVAPKVIGRNVNMHPLLTLLALMAGGVMFGIGGTLLAVPVAASLQVILVHIFPQLRTDKGSMEKAELTVKSTLSSEIEAAIPREPRRPRFARRRAAKESKEPAVLPPISPE